MTLFRHGILRQYQDGDFVVEFSKQQSPAKLGPVINANCWVQLGGTLQGSRREGLVTCYLIPGQAAF